MDTLSLLMYILGLIVDCAKVVAVIVAFLSVMASIKYLSMKWRGLLPSVAATAFVISIVSANLMSIFGVLPLLWARLFSLISSFYGGVTYWVVLFAIVLCCAIAAKLDISSYSSVGISKCNLNTRKMSTVACSLSNSYLAITPVLLS